MKRALITGGAVVGFLVALAVALPFLIPLSAYRSQIESRATTAINRAVKIEGPLRISFFPIFGLKANDVTVANVPGGTHGSFVQVDALEVAVALAPLLGGHVEAAGVRLVHPQIHLEVDEKGRTNWKLGTEAKSAPSSGSHAVHLADLKIEDGSLTYTNAESHGERSLDHLSADVAMPTGRRLVAHGNFEEKEKPIQFDATLDDADALGTDAKTRASVTLSCDLFHASFAGQVAGDGDAEGDLALDTASLRDLASLFGRPLSASGGLGHFALKSGLTAHATVYRLSNLSLVLDSITATGQLAVDVARDVPNITGSLAVGRLDLNPYLGSSQAEAQEPGWSNRPLSLSFLNDADADLKITAQSLEVRKLKIANANLAVLVRDGRLDASLAKFLLYNGQGDAVLHADASGPIPAFTNRVVFTNIQMAPFLSDTIGVTKLEGTGTIRFDVSSGGRSASDVMHAMAGSGSVAIHNGDIRGVDLGMVARTIQTVLAGGATSSGATTRFSSFGGSFSIHNGVLSNRDLALSGPAVKAHGQGLLNLGDRTIDFHIVPKAGGAIGLSVPVHITGTWDHLHYSPDLGGAVDGVLGDVAQGGSALKGLFTGNNQSSGQKKNSSVGDSVKSLFGIH